MAFFQLSSAFGATNTSCGILAADTYSKKESIGSQGGEKARYGAVCSPGPRAKRCKDEEDHGRHQETPFAGVVVCGIPKDQLTEHCSCERDRRNVLLRQACGVLSTVEGFQTIVRSPNNALEVSVREEASAASNDRPRSLPPRFLGVLEWRVLDVGEDVWGGVLAVLQLLLGHREAVDESEASSERQDNVCELQRLAKYEFSTAET